MPKIDWSPGSGRRGRPLRRVVGMGQREGLIVLSALAGVMVLVADYAAVGGFDDPARAAARSGSSGSSGDSLPGGPGGAAASGTPADPVAAAKALRASTQHYADLLAQGQRILGTTHYPDQQTYAQAFADPKSPAALFAAYRTDPNPEADSTYVAASTAARKAFGAHQPPPGLAKWETDILRVKSDLGAWVALAVRFQGGAAGQPDLDAAAAKVTADLTAAKADADSVAG